MSRKAPTPLNKGLIKPVPPPAPPKAGRNIMGNGKKDLWTIREILDALEKCRS